MDIERVVVRMIADATQYHRALGAMEGRLLAFAHRSTMLGASLSVPFIVAAGAVTATTTALVGASTAALKLAADYQSVAIAFEVMTGGANTAKQLLKEINQLAIETPFRSTELQEGAKQLKAFGFATDQVIPTLKALGQVSSGTGTRLERIILAFGQVRVAGRLMGPEVRQMVDAGVPIFEYLARVMNKPVTAIKGLVEEGQVGFPQVVRAFNMMTQEGGIFFNMMERQSQTALGRWSAFVETLEISLRDVGLMFFEGFGVADVLEEFRQATAQGLDRERMMRFFQEMRRGFDDFRSFLRMLGDWVEKNQELLKLIGQVILGVTALWAAMATLRVVLALVLIPVTLLVGQFMMLFRIVGVVGAAFLIFGDIPQHFMAIYDWVVKSYNSVDNWNLVLKKVVGTVILAATVFYTWRAAVFAVTMALGVLRGAMVIWAGIQAVLMMPVTMTALWVALGVAVAAVVYQFDLLSGMNFSDIIEMGSFFDRMGDFAGKLQEIIGIVGPELKRLFEAGDLRGAFEVALAGVQAAFKILVLQLKIEWVMFQHWLRTSTVGGVVDKAGSGLAIGAGAGKDFADDALDEINKARYQALAVIGVGVGFFTDTDLHERSQKAILQIKREASQRSSLADAVADVVKTHEEARSKELQTILDTYQKAQQKARNDLVDHIAIMGLRRGDYRDRAPGSLDVTEAVQDEMRWDYWVPRLRAAYEAQQHLVNQFPESVRLIMKMATMAPLEALAFNQPDVPGMQGRAGGGAGGGFFERLASDISTAGASGAMRVPHVVSSEVHELAKDLRREFEKEQTQGIGVMGGGRTEFFYKQMDLLEQGLLGPLGKISNAMSAVTGVGMTAGMTAGQGIMSEKLYEFGLMRNFGVLRDWVKRREHEDSTVKAFAKGSSEAMDVINKNMFKPQTAMEQARDILARAEVYEKEDQKMYAEMVAALKQIATEKGVSVKLAGFGANEDHVAPMPRAVGR